MSSNKMKGLLKGLRYISQIFENEKEPEMQIGLPTDVKHVAHIGWDGPSVNSPSWMNEFQASENGGDIKDDVSIKSEDSRSSMRSARDTELPKSTRRHASTGSPAEEPTRERSEKSRSRRSKQSNKDLSESTKSKNVSEGGGTGLDIPKKSRRKKSRDYADVSSRSSRTSRRDRTSKSDAGSECGSVSKSNNDDNNHEGSQTSGVNPSEGGQEKEHTGVP